MIQKALLNVAQDDGVAAARKNMRDAIPHGAAAQHGNRANLIDVEVWRSHAA